MWCSANTPRPHALRGGCTYQNLESVKSCSIGLLEGGQPSQEGYSQLSLTPYKRTKGIHTLTSHPSFAFIPCQTQLETGGPEDPHGGPDRSASKGVGQSGKVEGVSGVAVEAI